MTGVTCLANTGPSLRPDGFVTWTVDGRAIPVSTGIRFGSPVSNEEIGELLCADFGGLGFDRIQDLPAAIPSGEAVLTFGDVSSCNRSSLSALESCDPVIGSTADVNRRGLKLECNDPLDGTPVGGWEEPCNNQGGCDAASDLFCDFDGNICRESCFQDSDCGSCAFTTGGSCTCNLDLGLCERGGGGGDFTCADAGTLSGDAISRTDTTNGVEEIGICNGTGGDRAWRYTPATSGTFRFESFGHDTVLAVRTDCASGAYLACNDDGGVQSGASLLDVTLTGGRSVLVIVQSFSATGSYTLTINKL